MSPILVWRDLSSSNYSASSLMSRCSYHVFWSFRGEDTRKTFTDHLYTALVHAGIHTFRDNDELERGEEIDLNLHRAIEESRISIIVLSKDYASSGWCLNELVKILELSRSKQGVLQKHLQNIKRLAKVERWSAALREVADLPGRVLKDG
ncbi:unnamed protein product [Camellia sinensis]